VLVLDRALIDNFAYFLRATKGQDPFDVTPLVARWSATYDLYVRLRPDTPLLADGVRSTNERFRNEIEKILDMIIPKFVPQDRLIELWASEVTDSYDWPSLVERLCGPPLRGPVVEQPVSVPRPRSGTDARSGLLDDGDGAGGAVDLHGVALADDAGGIVHQHHARDAELASDRGRVRQHAAGLHHDRRGRDEQRGPRGVGERGDEDVARFDLALERGLGVEDDARPPGGHAGTDAEAGERLRGHDLRSLGRHDSPTHASGSV
jgi:hypothetical protein